MKLRKKKPTKIETVSDDFLTMQLFSNLNEVLEIETKNHANILRVIADSLILKYPFEMFSELIANHIRYTYIHSKECPFDDEVLEWASTLNGFKDVSVKLDGIVYTAKDFVIKNLTPSDANFFAWYCIEKTVNEVGK